jgi:hypothetical protein
MASGLHLQNIKTLLIGDATLWPIFFAETDPILYVPASSQ